MANEEVLGPRKTMFVLVIVVGCFAVLWPRILSPLILGPSREQLKPNQFDRDAGCCEVIFEKDMAILELLNEVCSSITHTDKLSPYSAAECRKAVNDTCGVDIVAFLKRSDNFGKNSKILVETMKNSNSSCLRENFGVAVWSLGPHIIQNSWTQQDTALKQERPVRGAGPHPALRERGRAIPAGAPAPPARGPVSMPPHARVRTSPLSVYFELDIKPPPIPGMRPPLGSPGGPVPTPKSSMGFVMPIYTICIIVFFVYTLSKILFKRTGTTYEPITPDPQFRRRVFRDDSRTTPDKLGPKERDTIVTAISGLVAEVQQQMEASYAQNQQRQDVQQDNSHPYTNGTILHNSGPVHIVASEYQDPKEKNPEPQKEKEPLPAPKTVPETDKVEELEVSKEEELKESAQDNAESDKETAESLEQESAPEPAQESKEATPELKEKALEPAQESKEASPEPKDVTPEPIPEPKETTPETNLDVEEDEEEEIEEEILEDEEEEELKPIKSKETVQPSQESELVEELINAADVKVEKNGDISRTAKFLQEETSAVEDEKKEKQSTPELLEEAIKDEDDEDDKEKSSVKHEAASVKSIFLETEIPQQSRVLVADFVEDRTDKPEPTKHSPMVVSGKMTLSLIQDAPRETPERDQESTMDDFTTASAVTQNVAEKEGEESDEEIEEEIEIEEIEEEVEEVEEEEEDEPEQKKKEPIKKTQ